MLLGKLLGNILSVATIAAETIGCLEGSDDGAVDGKVLGVDDGSLDGDELGSVLG